jgi:hypothetical protein
VGGAGVGGGSSRRAVKVRGIYSLALGGEDESRWGVQPTSERQGGGGTSQGMPETGKEERMKAGRKG